MIFSRINALIIKQLRRNVTSINASLKSDSKQMHLTSSTLAQDTQNLDNKNKDTLTMPPILPVVCCGTGCQNCAWLQYAEALLKFYGDSCSKNQENIHKAVMDEINKLDDENLKSFLTMELKMKLKI